MFFSLFTIFSVVVYFSTTRFMLHRERTNVAKSIENIRVRLAQTGSNLTLDNISNIIQAQLKVDRFSKTNGSTYIYRTGQTFDSMLYFNQEMTLYDNNKRAILTTVQDSVPKKLNGSDIDTVQIDNLGKDKGFFQSEPIYSEKTGKLIGYVQVFYNLNRYYDMRRNLIIFLVFIETMGIGIALMIIILTTRRFVHPFENLHDVMRKIADNPSNLKLRSHIKSGDEIEELSMIFDNMLDKLEGYTERQSRFISDVSHELRTPVAVIKGHVGMLQRWGKDDAELLDESLAATYHEADRMSIMINDMLDMIRVQGSFDLHKGKVANLEKSIETVLGNFKVLKEDFTFTFDNKAGASVVGKIYKNHFEQAIMILIDNAVKYSINERVVAVTLDVKDNHAIVSVKDWGEGIAEEDIKFIFDRFYRTDKSRNRTSTQAGLGIGLSVLKQIVDAYDLEIDVKSKVNEGTEFLLTIPLDDTNVEN